jgi:uncharacterized protein (TIGR02444 family)
MTALWDAVCALYARPGVKDLCLELQDAHGLDVPLLLVVATLARQGRALGDDHLEALAAASAPWQAAVVGPLRQARRALRDGTDAGAALGAEADTLQSLKAAVQAAELAAERIQIDALERAAADWPADTTVPPAEAVARVLGRWGAAVPPGRLAPFVD